MTIPPNCFTAISLSTIESSNGDEAPLVLQGARRKTGGYAKLRKIQKAPPSGEYCSGVDNA
jgi:hypothetical protein